MSESIVSKGKKVWVIKHYKQSYTKQPEVVGREVFQTKQEAMEVYQRIKRTGRWPWEFYGCPVEEIME